MSQFYGILFRRKHYTAGKSEVIDKIFMMVGKGMLDNVEPHRAQHVEEALWRTDASHRMQFPTDEIGNAAGGLRGAKAIKAFALQSHRKLGAPKSRRWRHGSSVEHQRIHLHQARQWFAQGPRRQAPAVHHAAVVEYGQFEIALQAVML